MRLFIGLALPENIRSTLSAVQSGLPGAKWVKPENFHMTLRFIGDTERRVAEDIDSSLSDIRVPAFDMKLSGLGCFETKGRVRSLWVQVLKSEPLKRLHEKIESAVVRTGFEPERRKFKPHITLARFKGGASSDRIGMFMETHNGIQIESFTVNQFTLFRSHLGGEGSVYEPLAEYELYEEIMIGA
ncbi:MAG: RNA 2',3'-cyclic phosphodiesterase [Rhodospirillaceae bacterium]|jgi:2'-5' RNA ligase